MMKFLHAISLCLFIVNINPVLGFKLLSTIKNVHNIHLQNESPSMLKQIETSTLSLDAVLAVSNLDTFQNIFSISNNSTEKRKSSNNWNKFSIPKSGSGMGSAINDFIIQYFTDSKYTDNNGMLKKKSNYSRLQIFLKQYHEQLNYVHIITLMYRCSRNRIPVNNFIPLTTINKILNSSLSRPNKPLKNAIIDNNDSFKTKSSMKEVVVINKSNNNNNNDHNSNMKSLSLSSNRVYKPREISNVLYGLRSLFNPLSNPNKNNNKNDYDYDIMNKKEDSTTLSLEQHEVISTVTHIISRCSNHSIFTGQEIASAFYGLYHLSTDHTVTRVLLNTLLEKLQWSSKVRLTSQEIGMAFNGLRQMSLDHVEVIQAIEFLTTISSANTATADTAVTQTKKISSSTSSTTDASGSSSVSSSGSSGGVAEVVLSMDEQYVGLALNGLQSMYRAIDNNNNNNNSNNSSNKKEEQENIKQQQQQQQQQLKARAQKVMKNVFALFNDYIKQSKYTQLSALTLVSIFQGLHIIHIHHHSYEFTTLLNTISEKIQLATYVSDLNEETIGQILGSFRYLTDTHVSTRKLIKSLNRHIDTAEFVLYPRKFSYCMSGLKSMEGNVMETKELLVILLSKVEKEVEKEVEEEEVIKKSSDNIDILNTTSQSTTTTSQSIATPPPSTSTTTTTTTNSNNTTNKKSKSLLLTSSDVGRLIYGLQNMNAHYNKPVQSILQQINLWLLRSPDLYLSGHDLGLALYGFKSQQYKDKIPVVQEIMMTIAKKMSISPPTTPTPLLPTLTPTRTPVMIENINSDPMLINSNSPCYLNAQSLSMAMLGLQNMRSSQEEIEMLLEGITHSMTIVDAQSVGNVLYSMRYMSTESKIVRQFLSKLNILLTTYCERITTTPTSVTATTTATSVTATTTATRGFTTQEFANALWGMRGFDSKYPETVALLATLADQLYTQVLESNQVAKAQLRSQQRLEYAQQQQQQQQADVIPLQQLPLEKVSNTKSSTTITTTTSSSSSSSSSSIHSAAPHHLSPPSLFLFSPQEISMALSGLQSMSATDGPAVLFMLGLLADRLDLCREELKPGEIANILFGLQGMTAEHEEVRAVLAALLPKMKTTTGIFTARDIGFSILGLTNMEPAKLIYEEVWEMFEEINVKVGSSELKGQPELLFEVFANGGIKIGGGGGGK